MSSDIGKILAVVVCEQHEHRILGVAVGLQPLTQTADKGVRLHGLRHGAGVLLLLRLGRVRHGAVVDHRAGTDPDAGSEMFCCSVVYGPWPEYVMMKLKNGSSETI